MRLVTKHTDYAVQALLYLARREKGYTSTREISEMKKVPLPFLRRILQVLTKEGFVTAKEGARGGVALRKAPREIKLTDIIRIFQGNVNLIECMFKRKVCFNRGSCPLRKKIKAVEEKTIRALEEITISSLING